MTQTAFPDLTTRSHRRGAPMASQHGRWRSGYRSRQDWASRREFDRLADGWRAAAFGNPLATVAPHLPRSTFNGVQPHPPASPRWQQAILSGFGPAQARAYVTTPAQLAALEAATDALAEGFEGMRRRLEQAGWAVRADDLHSLALVMRDLAALLMQALWVGRIIEIAHAHVETKTVAEALAASARAAVIQQNAAITSANLSQRSNNPES